MMKEKNKDFKEIIKDSFVQNIFFTLESLKKNESKKIVNQEGYIKSLNTKRVECYGDFRPISKII